MQYIISPPSKVRPANYTRVSDSVPVHIDSVDDSVHVYSECPVVTDLTGYEPIPDPNASARLETAKAKQISSLDSYCVQQLTAGVLIDGVTWAAEESDQNSFAKALTALKLLQDLGQYADATLMSAVGLTPCDAVGAPHDMTCLAFKQLILAYMGQVAALRLAVVGKRAAVNAATTVEDVEAIR